MVKNTAKWPKLLFVLDILGAIIAAIGIMEFLDNGSIEAVLLVVAGLVLMLPLILHILKRLPAKRSASENSDGEY